MFTHLCIMLLNTIMRLFRIISHSMILKHSFNKIRPWSIRFPHMSVIPPISRNNLVKFNNTRMTQLKKIIKLTICTLCISNILICVTNLLNGKYLIGLFVTYFIHLTICTFSNHTEDLEAFIYVVIYVHFIF